MVVVISPVSTLFVSTLYIIFFLNLSAAIDRAARLGMGGLGVQIDNLKFKGLRRNLIAFEPILKPFAPFGGYADNILIKDSKTRSDLHELNLLSNARVLWKQRGQRVGEWKG